MKIFYRLPQLLALAFFTPGLLIVLVSACTRAQPAGLPTPAQPKIVASPMPTLTPIPLEIQAASTQQPAPVLAVPKDPTELMRLSHTLWRSLYADYLLINYQGDAANTVLDTTRTQVWLAQPRHGRLLSGPANGVPQRLWVSDGTAMQENGGVVSLLPPNLEQPFIPPPPSDTVYPHPFAGLIGSVMGDYIFNTSLAQRSGEYRLVGSETFAGRQALVVEYFRYADGNVIDRQWIDAQTGLILRYVSFGKPAGGPLSVEVVVQSIVLEPEFSPETFASGQKLPSAFASSWLDLGVAP